MWYLFLIGYLFFSLVVYAYWSAEWDYEKSYYFGLKRHRFLITYLISRSYNLYNIYGKILIFPLHAMFIFIFWFGGALLLNFALCTSKLYEKLFFK